jgi:hypothetical protein
MPSIPRIEVGRFVDAGPVESHPKVSDGAVLEADEIVLRQADEVIARLPVEPPPSESWGGTCEQRLVASPDGKWLWHLGYESGEAKVTLMKAADLTVLDVHYPETVNRYEDKVERLSSWYEMAASTDPVAPELLLAYGNAGDSFAYLLTLRATASGIEDPVGKRLYNAVADRLDETLWSARFLSPDRLLVIDDIGTLTLFSWPSSEQLASISVMSGLRDEDWNVCIWPEDASDPDLNAVVAESVGRVDDLLLVSVIEGEGTYRLLAVVVVDAHTLEPKGLVRPPVSGIRELTQLPNGQFADARHAWRFVPADG